MASLNQARAMASRWDLPPVAPAAAASSVRGTLVSLVASQESPDPDCAIFRERSWREAPETGSASGSGKILVRRWKEDSVAVRTYASAGEPHFAVVAVALRATNARLTVDGECVHDGALGAGFATMCPAGLAAKAEFRAPCDFLHLYVPQQRLSEITDEVARATRCEGRASPCPAAADPLIERLSWLLLKGGPGEIGPSRLYLDGIALAIISRLLHCSRADDRAGGRGLVKWRLKRVQQFIEDQLSERLSLADLARAAGLSRMHFAAQFRLATGMRPHEYVVRRRIQRAQEMLLTTSTPLVEVALGVGFQTQAHFTTVFRRFLGDTPGRWREAQRLG